MSYRDHHAEEYEEEHEEDDAPSRGIFSRFRDLFSRGAEDDEDFADEPLTEHGVPQGGSSAGRIPQGSSNEPVVARVSMPPRNAGGALNPLRRSAPTIGALRVERQTHVTVRRTVQSFEDVRRAVDGLREGVQQIVNIEQTPSDVAERLIDFMNGATYALDGSVEKIGGQVYLFTPNSITIDVEERSPVAAKKPFFDRE